MRRIGGVLCFVVAFLLLLAGMRVMRTAPSFSDPSRLWLAHAVGAFLPALVALIIGLWLFRDPN